MPTAPDQLAAMQDPLLKRMARKYLADLHHGNPPPQLYPVYNVPPMVKPPPLSPVSTQWSVSGSGKPLARNPAFRKAPAASTQVATSQVASTQAGPSHAVSETIAEVPVVDLTVGTPPSKDKFAPKPASVR